MNTKLSLLILLSLLVACIREISNNTEPEVEEYSDLYNCNPMNTENPPVYVWSPGKKYYYGFDNKIYLNVIPNKIVLCFDKEYIQVTQDYLKKHNQILDIELVSLVSPKDIFILTTAKNSDICEIMEDLKKQTGIKSVNPMYDNKYCTDEIIVKFKDHVSQQEIDRICQKYYLKVIKRVDYVLTSEFYLLLSVPINLDPLEVANAIQESGLVIYSHPSFISELAKFP